MTRATVRHIRKIEVLNGVVIDVDGLPDDWDYEIVDHDKEESK